jgi:hypothetical protein
MKDIEEHNNEQIKFLGFDPEKLNEDQKYLLLEPSEAPENYMQDGELDKPQARAVWMKAMQRVGFTALETFNTARKLKL